MLVLLYHVDDNVTFLSSQMAFRKSLFSECNITALSQKFVNNNFQSLMFDPFFLRTRSCLFHLVLKSYKQEDNHP